MKMNKKTIDIKDLPEDSLSLLILDDETFMKLSSEWHVLFKKIDETFDYTPDQMECLITDLEEMDAEEHE